MAILMYNITLFFGRCKICHSITNLCKKKNTARAWEWWKWRSLPVKDWFWLADSPGADLFSTVIDILVLNSGIKHLGIRRPGIRHSGNDSQKHRFPFVQLEHNFAFQTATTHTISLAHKSLIEDCLCQSTIRKFVLYTYLSYWGNRWSHACYHKFMSGKRMYTCIPVTVASMVTYLNPSSF